MIKTSSIPIAVIAADDVLREALSMSLSARGFPVSVFDSVPAFLKDAARAQIRCLIADLAPAGGAGGETDCLDISGSMKAHDLRLPMIFLSGLRHADTAPGKELVLLTKPVEPALLTAHILKAAARVDDGCKV